MFKRLASIIPNGAQVLTGLHPVELIGLLEQAWNLRVHQTAGAPTPPLAGHPYHRSDIPGMAITQLPLPVLAPPNLTGGSPPGSPGPAQLFTNELVRMATAVPPGIPGVRWDHLIYAYMIENTRIYEIFRRVVQELLHGEKLGTPSVQTQLWLRNTEELFYRDPPPFSITTISSHIRPDLRATRRNAYQRMFGMDLNHGSDDNSPYQYVKAEAANTEFFTTFEELLREVWIGRINITTTSGANPTDDKRIEEHAEKMHNMLNARRQFGNLSREEFFSVAMMSWFHLSVDSNLPVIFDLRADAVSPEQRLLKIAQLVGLPAHGLSRSYFEIAEAISAVLIAIETGALHQPGAARAFYDPTAPNSLANTMNTINTHWSITTGHDMKAGKVAVR